MTKTSLGRRALRAHLSRRRRAFGLPALLALLLTGTAAAQYRIDIDSRTTGPLSTEPGWSSLDATNGGSVTVDGIRFAPFSEDGSRIRSAGGAATPNNLTGDFVFDDGAGQAVGLLFGGAGDLPEGIWRIKIWMWDGAVSFGPSIVGYRRNNIETIVAMNVVASPDEAALVFDLPSDGIGAYDVFVRENNSENRARLNAVEILPPGGPTGLLLSGQEISKSAAIGSPVGTFSTEDPTPADTFTYTFISGVGDADNFRFAIAGDGLETNADLSALPVDVPLNIRVRTTDAGGGSFDRTFAITLINDDDEDGLNDDWEKAFFDTITAYDGDDDPDDDGLDNASELAEGTDPTNPDTDGDGIDDGPEVAGANGFITKPLLADTDEDGRSDGDERDPAKGALTDPLDPDSDNDTFSDGLEISVGTDPNVPASFPSGLALQINEIAASNTLGLEDGFGDSSDWIELHNPNLAPVSLDGFSLSDDDALPRKWTFPDGVTLAGKGYLVVFATGRDTVDPDAQLHTNFKLVAGGETLALTAADGSTASSFGEAGYPKQFPDISYGLHPTSGALRYFGDPTPGEINDSGAEDVVRDTRFSVDRGIYTTTQMIEITTDTVDAEIRFTTDGSVPSPTNGDVYGGAIEVATTTTLRAIALRPGWISTNVDTHTYVFPTAVANQPASPSGWPSTWGTISQGTVPDDYEMDPRVVGSTLPGYSVPEALTAIPTMSIVLPLEDFVGPQGIYSNPLSRGSAWERECSLELIHPDGTPGFQHDCIVETHGNSSRNPFRMQKHSLRVTFRAELGTAKLRYPLFSQTDVDTFNKLVLRACFTDSWGLASWAPDRYRPNDSQYVRDVWMKESFRAMGQPSSAGNFVHLYVNGLYWGLYNPTERLEEEFFASHLGGEEDDWEINADFSVRTPIWNEMVALPFPEIGDRLDLANFADYMLLHFFGDAEDWPHHNGYAAANEVSGDGRFRFFVWDQEIVLDKFSWNPYDEAPTGSPNPGPIFQDLRTDPGFRLLFADRVQRHLFNGGALSLEAAQARYSEITGWIDQAIVAESARWGDVQATTPYGNPVEQPFPLDDLDDDAYPPAPHAPSIYFTREDSWVVERDNVLNHYLPILHDQSDSRSIIRELRAEGLFPSLDAPEFSQHGGFVAPGSVIDLSADDPIFYTTDGSDPADGGAATGASVTIGGSTTLKARARRAGEWSALTEAYFSAADLVISEIMYHPSGDPLAEFIEITNTGSGTISLEGVAFTEGVQFAFAGSAVTALAPGARALVVRDLGAFQAVYGGGFDALIAGEFSGGTALSNGGEWLTLSGPDDTVLFRVRYRDNEIWPPGTDGDGRSLVLVDPETIPGSEDSLAWRASTGAGGNPGAHDVGPVFGGLIPGEDADGDGLSAFLEHALGTSDGVADPDPVTISETPEGIVVQFARAAAADDAELIPEVSIEGEPFAPDASAAILIRRSLEPDGRETLSYLLAPPTGTKIALIRIRATGR